MADRLTSFARALRQRQTDVERKLWAKLRDRRLGGLKFRRQHPCGPFIADFVCEEAMLIVELDGSQHGDVENAAADAQRTNHLEKLGYKIARVWNSDVNKNMAGVLSGILAAAASRQTSSPSSALGAPSPVPGEEK